MRWAFERFFGGMPGASETESVCVMIRLASSGCTRTHVHTKARCEKTAPSCITRRLDARAVARPWFARLRVSRRKGAGCAPSSGGRAKEDLKDGFAVLTCTKGVWVHSATYPMTSSPTTFQLPITLVHAVLSHAARARRQASD